MQCVAFVVELRRGIAGLVLMFLLGAAVAVVRSVRVPPDTLVALGHALDPVLLPRQTPTLVLLIDPECAACRVAEEELRLEVRPGELGVNTIIVSRDDERFAPVFDALGFGVFPAYLFVDSRGIPRALLRGSRRPNFLRVWLEDVLARSLGPDAANAP